jgi:hypothetical protein
MFEINKDWRITGKSGNFTLEEYCTGTGTGGKEGTTKWTMRGYHGTLTCALRGFVRHSPSKMQSVEDFLAFQDQMDTDIKKFKRSNKL